MYLVLHNENSITELCYGMTSLIFIYRV